MFHWLQQDNQIKMSCQKLSRQYLYMVLRVGRGMYNLKDMDISRLFYPSREEAKAAVTENSSSALVRRIKDTSSLQSPA